MTAPNRFRAAVAAALALGVALVHVVDQGGVPGSVDSVLVARGYWLLEVAALLVAAALLLAPTSRTAWLLAAGVALGPAVGYVLSRGPGLPGAEDEIGRWTEPLGLLSLVVEGALLLVAAGALAGLGAGSVRSRGRSRQPVG